MFFNIFLCLPKSRLFYRLTNNKVTGYKVEDVDQLHWLELPGNIATDDSLLSVKPQIL